VRIWALFSEDTQESCISQVFVRIYALETFFPKKGRSFTFDREKTDVYQQATEAQTVLYRVRFKELARKNKDSICLYLLMSKLSIRI
jgi:hypothetical protein